MKSLEEKHNRLVEYLSSFENMVIAYSGGVDSTFLASVAHDVLKDKMLAVTATGVFNPLSEKNEAREIAEEIGFRHSMVETNELNISKICKNAPDRCYYCKKAIFEQINNTASDSGIFVVAEGTTLDDASDFRPGMRAISELGVISPLKECELFKDDIRELSKKMGIPTAHKASFACLASRIPYGSEITVNKLDAIEKAEDILRKMGLTQFRVRHHGDTARIEVEIKNLSILTDNTNRKKLIRSFKYLGFNYITLDLEGYRTGSMNEIIDDKEKYL